MTEYNFNEIEKKWQSKWEEEKLFKAEDNPKEGKYPKGKYYALFEFPYPSGSGLHVGHQKPYVATDVIARKKRMEGYNVLFPIGFDAFGLPAENYAIKMGIHPAKATENNIGNFTKQLKMIGYSFDWDRCFSTTDLDYYKWTQWTFIQFFKAGLAYKSEESVNWCPKCKITIANEELENGKCERCGSDVEQKKKSQWMLKMQSYADKLIQGLDTVDYPENIKKQQIDWIGKSVGADIDFKIKDSDKNLKVFTTRPDTIFGVTYMVIAPEHSIVDELKDKITNFDDVKEYRRKASLKTELERTELQKDKTGVELKGIKAVNPITNEEIPVFVADYVMTNYGTGAIMAVPAHDQRDYDFAKKYDLPIIQVLDGGDITEEAYTEDGKHINSDFLNGLNKEDAIAKIINELEQKNIGSKAVNYKMHDFLFTRQHYWGEPIPLVYCEKCSWQALPESELPLELPNIEDYMPTEDGESPLAKKTEWVNTTCPKCGGAAKRETDTMPAWAGSNWYYIRYTDAKNNEKFADDKNLNYWLPVDCYIGGTEHVTRHLLYSRFWYKALYDLGYVPTKEPYAKRRGLGVILAEGGVKMSKSKGNVINPDDIVKKYGADTLRTYIMFMGPFADTIAWNEKNLIGVHRFLNKVWNLAEKFDTNYQDEKQDLIWKNKTIKAISERIEDMRFNTAVSGLMEYTNYLSGRDKISQDSFEVLLKLLSPFAPHISEDLWHNALSKNDYVSKSKWPEFNPDYLEEDIATIAIQINGKKKEVIEYKKDAEKEELQDYILNLEKVKNLLVGKEIKKVIVVPNKIVNIVI